MVVMSAYLERTLLCNTAAGEHNSMAQVLKFINKVGSKRMLADTRSTVLKATGSYYFGDAIP